MKMFFSLFKKELFILFLLIVIGFLVHSQSFQMVLYGDDWRFIYNYFTREEVIANFSPFSGIFGYLAPYGHSILTLGFLYQIFGREYYIYYLVPLIFKILTAFFIFITLRNISIVLKRNDSLLSFLAATLFLVGPIGIQAIDWAFHINVYISISIFVLGLFFQIKFYNHGGKVSLLLSLFLYLFSILFAPFRLLVLILISPTIDLIFLFKSKNKDRFLIFILKNTIFAIFIFIFFWVGLFGHSPRDIYSPFPITESIKLVIAEPILTTKTFLHWIGITILPSYPAGSPTSYIIGAVFILLVVLSFYIYRGRYIILGSILYFVPLFLMWLITPTRNTDSGDKYLPLSFLGLSFLIGILSLHTKNLKKIFVVVVLGLVLIQAYSTVKIYSYWISIGRSASFTEKVQEKIISHFPHPINSQRVIYLDFEDRAIQQSIEFGLGYRVAIFSGTKNLGLFPKLISDKQTLIRWIKEKIDHGDSSEKIISSIAAFQYKDREFRDVTSIVHEELRSLFKKPK